MPFLLPTNIVKALKAHCLIVIIIITTTIHDLYSALKSDDRYRGAGGCRVDTLSLILHVYDFNFYLSVKKPVLFVCKPAEDINQRLAEVDYKMAIMNDGARDFLGGYRENLHRTVVTKSVVCIDSCWHHHWISVTCVCGGGSRSLRHVMFVMCYVKFVRTSWLNSTGSVAVKRWDHVVFPEVLE